MKQNVYFFGKSAYVTYDFLIDRGVPPSTIYNHTSDKTPIDKRWYASSIPNNQKKKIIAYDSIPTSIIAKYKLPDYIELREIANQTIQKIREHRCNNISIIIKTALDLEYHNWEELKSIYSNELLSDEKLETFCKTHSVLTRIIELQDCGYKLKELFDAYYQYDDLVFLTDSFRSFCNKIRQIKKAGAIEEVIIHGLTNMPSNNLKKTEDVITEIKRLYYCGKKPNAAFILKNVNEYLVIKLLKLSSFILVGLVFVVARMLLKDTYSKSTLHIVVFTIAVAALFGILIMFPLFIHSIYKHLKQLKSDKS